MNRRDWMQYAAIALSGSWADRAVSGADQDALVEKAAITLAHFFRDPDMTW